jgi:pimeloyl-ACP methyl ester carboxylesterase
VRNYGTKSRHEVTDISCRGVNQAPVRRLLGVGLLLLAAQIGYCGVVAAASPAAPAFEETPCDVPNAANVAAGLRCGAVHVPRDYAHPESGTFALSLVIAKSAQQPAFHDPVIYISGGPGEPLTVYAAYQALEPYAAQRDLILVDQRGTGRSEPDLCRDLNRRLLDESIAFLADRTQDAEARLRTTYMSCHDEAVGRGVDLADFGTRTTAEDIDQVRQGLGIEHWNVYGESYGTTVAMTLMALHPDTLRSVVLDSVYPPDPMPPPSSIIRASRAAFFDACTQDKECAAATPDLAGLYADTLRLLAQRPLTVAVPPRMQMPDDRVQITVPLFERIVSQLLYYPKYYPTLPTLIRRIHDGETQGVAPLLVPLKAAASTQDSGVHAAVECRDRPHYRDPLPNDAGKSNEILYGMCRDWAELGPPPLIPQGASVPTLVLGGQFDPVAGPALGRDVADRIGPAARWIAFAGIGHNVRHFSACGAQITFDFVGNPDKPPDTVCASRMTAIFATK